MGAAGAGAAVSCSCGVTLVPARARIKPMTIDGKKVYQIGIPIHQGFRGIQEDKERNEKTLVNRLSPTVFDPNAYTPEFKGFLVKIAKA